MLRVGTAISRNCGGVTRRELLQIGGSSAFGLSLASALRASPAQPPGKADSCIVIWLNGGPSQHETFDPKPDQPSEIRGQYAPIETAVSGIRISSLLPQLARQADRYTIIRSFTHESFDHSFIPMMNGGAEARTAYGSVVSRFLGGTGAIPPYVHLGMRFLLGAGVLGSAHEPVVVTDPGQGSVNLPDYDPPPRVDSPRFKRRLQLLGEFETLRAHVEGSAALRAADATMQRALSMLAAPAVRDAFDLSREPMKLRERYGGTTFGQSCLLGRRLIEAGTRFVQVMWSDRGGSSFDTHGITRAGSFEMEQYLCPRMDQGVSALLQDMHERGLLKRTLVLGFGEFGRTHKINERGGRDHWPGVFSGFVAGGGTPAGTVVGSSDAEGAYPGSRPVRPGDLAATLYRLLGMSSLTDDRLRPFVRGGPVAELL